MSIETHFFQQFQNILAFYSCSYPFGGEKKGLNLNELTLTEANLYVLAADAREANRFVVDHISRNDKDRTVTPSFEFGCTATLARHTWEPAENIEYKTAMWYCRRRKLPAPDSSPWKSGRGLKSDGLSREITPYLWGPEERFFFACLWGHM